METIASILRKNILRYFPANSNGSEKWTVLRELGPKKTVRLENSWSTERKVWKSGNVIGEISPDIPSFSRGIFGHVMLLD